MQIKNIKVDKIIEYEKNPRKNDHAVDALAKMISEYGFRVPLLVKGNNLVDGHLRLKAAKKLGLQELPCHDVSDLTDGQIKALRIAINRSAELAEWDLELLADEIKDLKIDDDFDLELIGFDEDSLTELIDDTEKTVIDEVLPDLKKVAITKRGDLYEFHKNGKTIHKLICGDSTNVDDVARLMGEDKADIVVTSPPYNANTSFKSCSNSGKLYANYDDNLPESDYISFCQNVLNNCIAYTNGFIFWNINYNSNSRSAFLKQLIPYLDLLNEVICWKKNALPVPSGLTRNFEFIFVLSTKPKEVRLGNKNETNYNVWDINNIGSLNAEHRAAFPIELPKKGITLASNINDIVLDMFLGTGTTMVAAHQLNRRCYGLELDGCYCDIIIKRMLAIDNDLQLKLNGNNINKAEYF